MNDSSRIELKLDQVTLSNAVVGSTSYQAVPVMLASRVAADATEVYSLTTYYQSLNQFLQLLIVKATRPVLVTVGGVLGEEEVTYSFPPATYLHHLFNSKELAAGFKPLTVSVYNFEASSSAPTPALSGYPYAEVELLLSIQEGL